MLHAPLDKIRCRSSRQLLPKAPESLSLAYACRSGNVGNAHVICKMCLDKLAHLPYAKFRGSWTVSSRIFACRFEHIEHEMRESEAYVNLEAWPFGLKCSHRLLDAHAAISPHGSIWAQKNYGVYLVPHNRGKIPASYCQRLPPSNKIGLKCYGAHTACWLTLIGMHHIAINKGTFTLLE